MQPLIYFPLQVDGFHTLIERRMLWARGNLLLAEARPAEALQIAEALLNSVSHRNQTQSIPALSRLKGEALFALKQMEQAERTLQAAKTGAEQRQALPLLWQVHCQLGWLYKEQREIEKSEHEFASARQLIQSLGSYR